MLSPRGSAPRTPQHALSRAASPARSVRVARFAALARVFLRTVYLRFALLARIFLRTVYFASAALARVVLPTVYFASLRSLASFLRGVASLRRLAYVLCDGNLATSQQQLNRYASGSGTPEQPPHHDVHHETLDREGRKSTESENGHFEDLDLWKDRHVVNPFRSAPVVPELPNDSTDEAGQHQIDEPSRPAFAQVLDD